MYRTLQYALLFLVAALLQIFLFNNLSLSVLNFVCGKENVHDGGVPSARRLGEKSFTVYLALTVILHNAIFFYMEALSWSHALLTLLRLGVSAAVGVFFCWLIAQVFTSRLSPRI